MDLSHPAIDTRDLRARPNVQVPLVLLANQLMDRNHGLHDDFLVRPMLSFTFCHKPDYHVFVRAQEEEARATVGSCAHLWERFRLEVQSLEDAGRQNFMIPVRDDGPSCCTTVLTGYIATNSEPTGYRC